MPKTRLRLAALAAFALSLSLTAAAQDQKNVDEVKAVHTMAEQYFAAYSSKNADKLMSCWSGNSPDFASRRQQVEELFARLDKIEIKSFEVRKAAVDGEKAVIRVVVEMAGTEAKTENPAPGLGRMNRVLHFVKESGSWKILSYGSTEDELAAAIVNAKTAAERSALLEAEKELVTVELTKALTKQGNDLWDHGEFPRALDIFRLVLSLAEKTHDSVGVAGAYNSMGGVLSAQGDNTQALQSYEKSLALSEASGDKDMIARVLVNIGGIYRIQRKTEQALELFERSMKLASELDNKAVMAAVFNNMGNAYIFQGKYLLAIQLFQKALAEQELLGDKLAMSKALNNMAGVQATLGSLPDALASLKRSLSLSESVGYKEGIGVTLYNIGNIYKDLGNKIQALEYYQKSLAAGGGFGALVNIGALYAEQGDSTQALSYYLKALAILPADEQGYARAFGLAGVADVYQSQGNYPKALDYYQGVLTISETGGNKAETLQGIGKNYFLEHNYLEALDYYLKSLKMVEETGRQYGLPGLLVAIARVHLAQGSYAQALEFALRSADNAKHSGQVEDLWEAYTVAGQTYRALNQPEKARSSFESAIARIEVARLQIAGGEEQQQRFMEGKILPYQEMIGLLVAAGKPGEALDIAERSKGRVLLDVLQSGRVNVTKSMTAQESQEEKKFNNELVSLNAQISKENQQPQPNQKSLAELRARLEQTRLDHEAFRTSLYAAHPSLKVQRGEAPAITLEDAFGLLPDRKSALLEYVVTQDRTYLFVLSKSDEPNRLQPTLKVYPIEIKQKELEERVERYRQKIAKDDLDFRAPGRELYDLLIKPAQDQLRGKTSLVLVPDGVLWDLPFQALQSSAQNYLIEEQAISYAPSLTVLKEVARSAGRLRRNSEGSSTLLAFGNPTVARQTEQLVKAVFMDGSLEPLPEAEKQVTALAELYGPRQSRVYTGAEAREARAKAEAPSFRILHFATHGILDSASPMYSYLALSQAAGDAKEDGLLEAWEIMDLDLHADLVVLAACETARGRVGGGEGMIGMSWAFFVAGSPTTVASQWKVESASTTELMLEFHHNLRLRTEAGGARLSKARALQLASLKLLKSREYRHPFYWAGFVMIGDGY